MRKRGPDPESESRLPSAPQPLLQRRYCRVRACYVCFTLGSWNHTRPSIVGGVSAHDGGSKRALSRTDPESKSASGRLNKQGLIDPGAAFDS